MNVKCKIESAQRQIVGANAMLSLVANADVTQIDTQDLVDSCAGIGYLLGDVYARLDEAMGALNGERPA